MKDKFLFTPLPVMLISIFVIAGCTGQGSESDVPSGMRPNIIFIMADDLGYAEAGCYGQDIIKTPNIDGIAEKGMRFTQFYAGTAVCAPSRCVLMTGKHTGHSYIRDNANPE